MKSTIQLDKLDRHIIDLLQRNARMSNTELGKQIGLSQSAVTARIQKLEENGVISGYHARINARLLGMEIAALIRIKTTHAQIKACLSEFDAMPEISQADRITGEDCFIVRVVVASMPDLENAIDRLAKFGAVSTSIILATYDEKPIGSDGSDALSGQ